MTGKSKVVAICDPRLMKTFRSLSDSMELTFAVPESLESLPEEGVLVVDDECYRLLEGHSLPPGLEIVKLASDNILVKTLELIGLREVGVVVAGVDLGLSVNYVIFADNVLLKYGSVREVSELVKTLMEVRSSINPRSVVVKVGVSPAGLHETFLTELLNSLRGSSFDIMLIDEHGTSGRCPTSYVGRKTFKNDDIKACVNIALREGLRLATW